MVGFFKNLLSGILSFFVGLLRGNKAQEDKPSIKPAADKAKELPGKVTGKTRRRSGYFMELDESEETPAKANQSTNGAVAKTPVAATATKPAKEQPAKTDAAAASAQSAKVELVQTAEGVTAVPAEKTPAASKNGQTPTETTFAPKYLAPTGSSNSRRRPGPSMNPFLDMARQVKTPG
ncbi:MAG: hypothetical protein KME05_07470 [Gloeocapsa sp. UFS-A4-WI-NPMV-4B04]|jgi:hypothetical protein|nr:hypothetical protein [Gloeocapsa sp. UFS-A4-WI-NPMV-4B04]